MPALTTRPNYSVVQPGAYSAVSASELTTPAPGAGPIVAILGSCQGGAPNTPLYFTSPGVALQALRGGAAYDGVRFALGSEAPQVCVIRVGKEVKQGTLSLAGTAGNIVKLTSLDYGTWVNSIKVEVTSGPIVTLKYTDAYGNVYSETWNFTTLEGGTPTNAKVAEAINGKLFGYQASNYVTAAAEAGTGGLKVAAAAPLTGGQEEAPEATHWTKGLEALETQEVSVVVPMTGEASVHALVQAHCEVMSLPNARRERTCEVGGSSGETVAQQLTRVGNLTNARTQLVYPGFYGFNSKGEKTLYDPFYRAAKVAGERCALADAATSLTHKEAKMEIEPEVQLSTAQGGAIDQLLTAGIAVWAPKPGGGTWCVDDVTCSKEAAGTFRDVISVRSADYTARYLRRILETKYVGGKGLTGTRESMQTQAEAALKELVSAGIIRAYQTPTVEFGPSTPPVVTPNNSYNVVAPVMLVGVNKFIFITVALQSSSSIQAGA